VRGVSPLRPCQTSRNGFRRERFVAATTFLRMLVACADGRRCPRLHITETMAALKPASFESWT
jgi:hypothetical protein